MDGLKIEDLQSAYIFLIALREDDDTTGAALYYPISMLDKHRAS
jgi:hypothetical protein